MAWHSGQGTHSERKEAQRHQRKEQKLEALADANDPPPKSKRKARTQPTFGLKFWWLSMYSKREIAQTSWYRTEAAREAALVNAQKQKQFSGKPKFTRIEKVER